MKADEFKKILKPLIRQTIKEVILDEGVLSSVISEVVKGMQTPLLEARQSQPAPEKLRQEDDTKRKEEEYEKLRQEKIRRLNESAAVGSNVFENTSPLQEQSQGPLSNQRSNDAGVDISGILNIVNDKWRQLI